MGQVKNYLLELQSVGNTIEEADAIEWASFSGWLKLTGDLSKDKLAVAKELPQILEAYRRVVNNMEVAAELGSFVERLSS